MDLLELGNKIFRNNIIQLSCILICFILVFLAQILTTNLPDVSLFEFISLSIKNLIGDEKTFHVGLNVLLPAIMYLGACLLFLWMAISNFIIFNEEDNTTNIVLRIFLVLTQIILFGWFIYVGGKLFIYFAVFTAATLFIAIALSRIFSSDHNN